MKVPPMRTVLLLWAAASFCLGQQAKAPAKGAASAAGVFLGRSGKPMAKARVLLGEIAGDQEVVYAKIKLPPTLPAAVTDDQGRFQFKGFPPGEYTIVYQPAGTPPVVPAEINIKPFLAVTKSIAPLLRGFELGKNEPYPERPWGREFTLLQGPHVLLRGSFHEDLERHRSPRPVRTLHGDPPRLDLDPAPPGRQPDPFRSLELLEAGAGRRPHPL